MANSKFIINFEHGDLQQWMELVKTIIDDCGISFEARQEFARTVMKLLKSGKAFDMERSVSPGFTVRFNPSQKLRDAFDEIEAAR